MVKNKIVAIVVACVLIVSAGGYLVYQQFFNQFSLEFSEYYQQAEDFEELEPLLNQYFGAVQAAYDRSDKENLETFVLDDSYEEVFKILSDKQDKCDEKFSSISSLDDDEQKSYLATLKLLHPFLKIHAFILEKDVLLVANDYHAPNSEWFNKMTEILFEIYSEYANGNGEL